MAEVVAFRNNALPYPVYGQTWTVVAPLLDADGDPISPSSPDSERSLNGDTFADCTNEAVEIATSSGVVYLTLTAAEMTADIVTVRIQSTGAKTTIITLYPRKLVVLASGTCQGSNDTGDIQLASGEPAVDDYYNGCLVVAVIDGTTEARIINDYVGSTKVAEIAPAWNTAQPDSNDTYTIYLPEGRQIPQVNVVAISDDATAADNEEAFFDGTGYAGTGNVIPTVTTLTNLPAITANWLTATGIASDAFTAAKFAADCITAAKIANGAIDAATFAADVDAEILSYIVDDATRIDASALNTATGTTIPAILDDTDLIDDGTSGLAKIATDVAAILVDTGTTLQGELDGIQADTEDIQSRLPSALTGDGNIKADALKIGGADPTDTINAQADLALSDYDPPTRAELTSDINSVISYLAGLVIQKGTIGSTGNDTTHLHIDGATYGNDEINNYLLAVKDVSENEWHARYIEDFTSTGDLATVATLPFTPEASVDLYVILAFRQDVTGGSGLDAAGVRAAIGMASANLDTQLGDLPTNAELATSQAAADDATLSAIAALNNLSAAQVNAEVDTALADVGVTTTVTGRIDAAISTRLATAGYTAPPSAADNATAILAAGDVDGFSLEETLKLCLAALGGKLSGAATATITIRAADDSKTRVSATVDADGNRSAVTLDAAG